MNNEILKKAQIWTTSEYDQSTREEIQQLIEQNNEQELTDRFWKELEFGTGGLRGIRGAGTNRMNIYNIRKVTQGLANYIIEHQGQHQGVVIARDSRIFSLEFAQEAASVLIANGINVYFFEDICATPIISYTIIQLGAFAGIMNTASHNPKEYNGYKVFGSSGGQLVPPADKNVIIEVEKTSLSDVKTVSFEEAKNSPLFAYCDKYFEQYINEIQKCSLHPEVCSSTKISILYSPLHGCGYRITPELLNKFGFQNTTVVKEQSTPDGTFPYAPYPNPEEPEALELGISQAEKNSIDLLLATDPDADRIGVVYLSSNKKYEILNGNQIGILIAHYLIENKKLNNPYIVSTIVSTPLIKKIAQANNIDYFDVLTGFKWIADKISQLQKQGKNYLFGFEESNGYNISNHVMDKDGISAAAIISELTAYYRSQGKYLDNILMDIALKYGYYKDSQHSEVYKGIEGTQKIQKIMDTLRSNPPKTIGSVSVEQVIDYINDETGLPKSNIVAFHLSDHSRIIARPSGTEPKIKFYFSSNSKIECEGCIKAVDKEHNHLKQEFLNLLKSL
ncbi:MAG: phospho-sugar mutase [Brevinemataceae bacterium]